MTNGEFITTLAAAGALLSSVVLPIVINWRNNKTKLDKARIEGEFSLKLATMKVGQQELKDTCNNQEVRLLDLESSLKKTVIERDEAIARVAEMTKLLSRASDEIIRLENLLKQHGIDPRGAFVITQNPPGADRAQNTAVT